jgi:hypothetical protein
MPHARYVVIFDRPDDCDDVFPPGDADQRPPATDKEGMEQLAREIQEAFAHGYMAGFFRVVARSVVDDDEALAHKTPDEDAHRAAMVVLDNTRTY